MGLAELYRHLYPSTGYAFDAIGSAEKLRDITVTQVRDYHTRYYKPNNMTIFISGRTLDSSILEAITEIENKIVLKGENTPFLHQWLPDFEPLSETVIKTIYYPNDEESNCTIFMGWRGPNILSEYETLKACFVLLHYLCSSPISPLRRDLMEIEEEPLASQMNFEVREHQPSMLLIKLSGVPRDHVDIIDGSLMKVIRGIVNGDEHFDIDRMRIIIQNYLYEMELNEMERQPHLHIFEKILPTIIYGNNVDGDNSIEQKFLKTRFKLDNLTSCLLEYNVDTWIEILRNFFVEVTLFFS